MRHFKYLGTTARIKTAFSKELRGNIIYGNCLMPFGILLSSCVLYKRVTIKVHRSVRVKTWSCSSRCAPQRASGMSPSHIIVNQFTLRLFSPFIHLLFVQSVRVCAVRRSTRVTTVYLFAVPSVIIPTMLTDSDSDLPSSNAVKWWLLSSRGVRKYSVYPVNQKRTKLGEFHHIYQQLKQYPYRFYGYLRMSQSTLNYILRLIEPGIRKVYTNIRKQPIIAEERVEGECGVWPWANQSQRYFQARASRKIKPVWFLTNGVAAWRDELLQYVVMNLLLLVCFIIAARQSARRDEQLQHVFTLNVWGCETWPFTSEKEHRLCLRRGVWEG
jgi:hypothetical protein